MSKFIIEIKLADGNTKQVKVYVDNRTAELLNQQNIELVIYKNIKSLWAKMMKCLFAIKNRFGERLANAYFLKEMAYALANDKNR